MGKMAKLCEKKANLKLMRKKMRRSRNSWTIFLEYTKYPKRPSFSHFYGFLWRSSAEFFSSSGQHYSRELKMLCFICLQRPSLSWQLRLTNFLVFSKNCCTPLQLFLSFWLKACFWGDYYVGGIVKMYHKTSSSFNVFIALWAVQSSAGRFCQNDP